ncbi:MAG: VWA domain-containing protein [Oscillospiraceae bacterium]|nr:VWA domain-containing protein [Oscillospiraceae bacterium]
MNGNSQGSYQGSYQGNYGSRQEATNYTVDMVFCIDATGSMEDFTGNQQRIINMVKQNALNFYGDLSAKMEQKRKPMAQLRVRIVIFRDFLADGEGALLATDFFELPAQTDEFEACINSIHAEGGGDIPEDGLEALALAMKSKWTTKGIKKRQVIVVWTDAGTHELGHGSRSPYYLKGMPANLSELEEWWDNMDSYAKRLVMFAPDTNYWNYIGENWDNVIHVPSTAGNGLAEQTYSEILNTIANTMT